MSPAVRRFPLGAMSARAGSCRELDDATAAASTAASTVGRISPAGKSLLLCKRAGTAVGRAIADPSRWRVWRVFLHNFPEHAARYLHAPPRA